MEVLIVMTFLSGEISGLWNRTYYVSIREARISIHLTSCGDVKRSSSPGMGLLLVCGKFSSGVIPYVSLSFVRMEGKPNLGKYAFSFAGRVEDDWLWYMYVAVGWGCRALTSWWSLQTLITCGSFKTWQAQPPRNRVFVSTVNM